MDKWFLLWLNPEPWAIGEINYKSISPNRNLKAFQDAVREELDDIEMMPQGPLKLAFYFWRQQVRYIDMNDKIKQRHQADATNMQKALEDALQGVLFDNDRHVRDVHSIVMAQGPEVEPKIVIRAQMFLEMAEPAVHLSGMPVNILDDMSLGSIKPLSDNVWKGPKK